MLRHQSVDSFIILIQGNLLQVSGIQASGLLNKGKKGKKGKEQQQQSKEAAAAGLKAMLGVGASQVEDAPAPPKPDGDGQSMADKLKSMLNVGEAAPQPVSENGTAALKGLLGIGGGFSVDDEMPELEDDEDAEVEVEVKGWEC